jgi:hypothetical protein
MVGPDLDFHRRVGLAPRDAKPSDGRHGNKWLPTTRGEIGMSHHRQRNRFLSLNQGVTKILSLLDF